MVQKRPLAGDDSCVVSSKHAKFEDSSNHLVSFSEFPSNYGWKSYTSGKGYDEYTETCNITELPKECTEYSSGGNSNSSWASSCTSEEDFKSSEAPFYRPVTLEDDELDYPSRTRAYCRDPYARLMELPPQKLVPIGSEYQAEVPEFRPYGDSFDAGVDDKFCGTCVTPMPAMELIAFDDYKTGYGRRTCICVDPGSITCVRHHVVEAREDLRRLVGHECFIGLGMDEMGEEVVSERWTEEDEQIFEEVVISNPSSAGKNFWDCLSAVFPTRTKMEIISYYYNVFMLRKRAKQNRSRSMNIDSDDDEWEESDDELLDCEDDTESEEEDSVVEYPAFEDIPGKNGVNGGSHDYETGAVKDAYHQYNTDFSDLDGICSLSETWKHNYYGTDPMFSPSQRSLDIWGNHDLSSHTPSGTGSELQASKLKAGQSKSFAAPFNGASAKGSHGFFLEPYDAKVWGDDKVWDFGYATCRSNDVEFLSTSNVMEVFGVEDWNNNASDDKPQ